MTYIPLSEAEPRDLEICECYDADLDRPVFGQWLAGPKAFFDAAVEPMDTVTKWRRLHASNTEQ